MSQLLQRGIVTVPYTNALLRNLRTLGNPPFLLLRSDGYNLPDFSKVSVFKPLVLDLARQVDASLIKDVAIITILAGESKTIDEVENRLILIMENEASFSSNDNRYTPAPGDLIWTNETITIDNHSTNHTYILIVDFEEFLL